jgi:DNA-binding transcriptional MerR regulator
MLRPTSAIPEAPSHEIELFDPPPDAIYTIEATARLVDVPRRTILLYCKHRLLSPVINAADRGYSFDRTSIQALRRIEALRPICGDDLAGIKIILDLTDALERLRSEMRSMPQTGAPGSEEETTQRTKYFVSQNESKTNRRRKKT